MNSFLDNGDGANTTLREAIEAANANPAADTIEFASTLNNATITLTQGELTINDAADLTINGADGNVSRNITINAGGNGAAEGFTSRIFSINDGTSGDSPPLVTMVGLHLTGGDANGEGGAIYSTGQLVLQDCIVDDNASSSQGRGVFVFLFDGSGNDQRTALTLVNTHIDDNTSGNGGGGIDVAGNRANVSVLQGSTVSGNTSTSFGGGIYSKMYDGSSVSVEDSTISGNRSGFGDGDQCTMSGKMAKGLRGGAICAHFALAA